MFSLLLTLLQSRPPNFLGMCSWSLESSQLPWLKEKKPLTKSKRLNIPWNSNLRRPPAWELQLAMWNTVKKNWDRISIWLSISWFHWLRRAGKTSEPCISRHQWENHTRSLADSLFKHKNPFFDDFHLSIQNQYPAFTHFFKYFTLSFFSFFYFPSSISFSSYLGVM